MNQLAERERQHIARALRWHASGLRKLAAESNQREFDLLIIALRADAAESERLAALLAPEVGR